MAFKKFGIVLFLVFSMLPISVVYAQVTNVGFVPGNIWYSKDPFEEGNKIKIYTFIFNPDNRELFGTVVFFDKTVLLGKKEFTIPAKTANDISIDWTVTAGDHVIFGKIENAKFLISEGKYEETYIAENETEKSLRSVSKKIISQQKEETESKTAENGIQFVSDVKKLIEEKMPNSITKPIVSSINKLDEFREDIIAKTENKKEKVKNEIKILEDETKANSGNVAKDSAEENSLLKPFKQAELFLLSAALFALNNGILFYGIIAIVVFFILRYIRMKIF